MKKYLLILIVAIFCLPNESFAQLNSIYMSDYVWNANATVGMPYVSVKDILKQQKQLEQQKTIKKDQVKKLKVVEESIDKATGISTIRWEDGSSYVGETYLTVFHGMGTMIYPDKGKYHGQWKYDHRDGIGTMEYADGSKYVGKWVRDLPNGEGTFINPEGIAFSGTFKNGVPHGKCVMQDLDGRKYTARWVRGKLKEKSIKPLKEKK